MALKPPPPVEKLPVVYLMSVVKDPDKKEGWWNVVLVAMQGDRVLGRRVLDPAETSVDHALDQFNQVATRVFYFSEGEEMITA